MAENRHIRALIVEDNPGDVRLLCEMFADSQHIRFDVTTTERLEAARALLAQQTFDVILLDLSLPDSFGISTLEAMLDAAPDTPIVVLTVIDDETGIEAVSRGAQDYLIKGQFIGSLPVRAITYAIERMRTERMLRESEAKFRGVIEQAIDGIILIDADGTLVEWNDAMERITGIMRDAAVGRPVWDLPMEVMPPALRTAEAHDSLQREMSHFFETGERQWDDPMDTVEILRPDGETRYIQIAPFPLDVSRKRMFGAIIRDVTERVQAEMAEREQRELADALREAAATLSSTLDLDEVMTGILDIVGRVAPHDAAKILLIEGDRARVAYWRGYPPADEDFFRNHTFDLAATANLRTMLRTREPLLVPDTSTFDGWIAITDLNWVKSQAGARGQVIGFITLDSQTPGFFTPAHLERLRAFASQTAIAIENAQLYREVRLQAAELERRVDRRTMDLHIRNAVATVLTQSLDPDTLLQNVIQTLVEELGILGGAIFLENGSADTLTLHAHSGLTEDALAQVLELVPGRADRHNEQQVFLIDHATGVSESVLGAGIRAVISVPIRPQNRIKGLIMLVDSSADFVSHGRMKLFDAIGKQVSVALSNARLYEHALHEEARTRAIIDSVNDGLVMLDPAGQPVLMNPASEAMLGFYPQDLGGPRQAIQRLWEWLALQTSGDPTELEFPLPTRQFTLEELRYCAAICPLVARGVCTPDEHKWKWWLNIDPSSGYTYEACPLYRQTTRRVVEAHVAPVRSPDGQSSQGTVIALHDVTYYREVEQLKDSFVSAVSHELRTPLAAVMLNISTLQRYYDRLSDADRRRRIDSLNDQAQVLRKLIDEILELSRLEARKITPDKKWFDLTAHCAALMETIRPLILEKRLFVEFDASTPHQVYGDPEQLGRVFSNILGNAIKYTPEGGRVRVSFEHTEGETRMIIADTGIGIDPEDQPYVFDRFYRGEHASDMASGTGLGLAITKEIIDLHQGRIELHSVPGEGSVFTVYLPVPAAAPDSA